MIYIGMNTETLLKLLKTTNETQKDGTLKIKIEDTLQNYITYFKNDERYVGKLTSETFTENKKNYIRYLFDGASFSVNNSDNVILQALIDIENDTITLKKVNDVVKAIKFICNENKTCLDVKNDVQSENISLKYQPEFDEIESLLDEITNDDTIKAKNDWSEYRDWKNIYALKTYNADGEVTGIDSCYDNIVQWLENFPKTKGRIKYNDKSKRVEFNNKIYGDNDVHSIMGWLNKYFIRKYSNVKGLNEAIKGCANKHHYNPFKQYLDSLNYDDSKDWIKYLLDEVLKCEFTDEYGELFYEELRLWLYAAVKRVYEPGCKFDNILVFVSENGGTGKTSMIEQLFKINNTDYAKTVDASQQLNMNDRFFQQCSCNVCVNFDEVAMKSANVNKIKTMLTQTSDEWHTLYAVADEPVKRDFVFAGSTNNTDFLKDYTSMFERRWWIIKVTEDTTNGIRVNTMFNDEELNLRDKIWAQVKHMYDNKQINALYITQGSALGLKLEALQRGYKASNNESYEEIKQILNMHWGFTDDKRFVNIDNFVKQYKFGDVADYCKRRNKEIYDNLQNEHYTQRPEDVYYRFYGKVDRWPITSLYNLLDRLGIDYTKQSLANEIRYGNEFERKYIRFGDKTLYALMRKTQTKLTKIINDYYESEKDNAIPF